MRIIIILATLLISVSVSAQDNTDSMRKEASKESQVYHIYRQHLSYPPYSYEKIRQILKKQIITDSEDNLVLKKKIYEALLPREKFTYTMIHGEAYSQNCDAMPLIQDEQMKIFSYLPDLFNEYSWNERQQAFLKENKDSVITWIKECSSKNNRIGLNFKHTIWQLNATETIPYLISVYNITKKDHDILTLLMLMMKENSYEPFVMSPSYKKLYGETSNYQDYIKYNKANEELIIKRATDFYNGLKK